MTRIKMHIFNVKLPFYPSCEVKYGLQNRVSTVVVKLDIVIFNLHSTLSLLFSICNYFGSKSRFALVAELICIYHSRILVNLICVFLLKCKKSYDLTVVIKLNMS